VQILETYNQTHIMTSNLASLADSLIGVALVTSLVIAYSFGIRWWIEKTLTKMVSKDSENG
jgi:hypothetical protein